ncbi:hypothetical protein LJC30_05670 [Odoribacter sp. OttesenSCG-928-L07]|nr:hypothetical protein [Odoribacter sp. OttesenSCG-928-L07]
MRKNIFIKKLTLFFIIVASTNTLLYSQTFCHRHEKKINHGDYPVNNISVSKGWIKYDNFSDEFNDNSLPEVGNPDIPPVD